MNDPERQPQPVSDADRLSDARLSNLMKRIGEAKYDDEALTVSISELGKLCREVADARRAAGQVQAPPVAAGAPSQALTAEDVATE